MPEPYILGVDGGATKTECAVSGPDGEVPAIVRGSPSNHESVGYDEAARSVADVVGRALEAAQLSPGDILAACFAMAGMDLPPDRENIRERIVTPLGLDCLVTICNDAYAGFLAGSPRGLGVCVSLGTADTFCGRNADGDSIQLEYPRLTELKERITRVLFMEQKGIGPTCGFRDPYLQALGLKNLDEFLWSMYAHNRPYAPQVDPVLFGAAQLVLFDPTHHDDPVLCRVFSEHAEDVSALLIAMARRLHLAGRDFDLVLSGSVLTQGRHPVLNGTIIERVTEYFPTCAAVTVDGPPVLGGLRIAGELLPDT